MAPKAQWSIEVAWNRTTVDMGTVTRMAKSRKATGTGDRSGTAPATIPESTRPANSRAPSGAFHMNSTEPEPQAVASSVVPRT